jgi:outer membrane protein TolC
MRLPLVTLIALITPLLAQAEPLPSPLTLNQALELADTTTHPEVMLRQAEVEQARAVSLDAGSNDDLEVHLELSPRWIVPPLISPQDQNDSQAHLIARKRLYDFGQTKNRLDAAALNETAKQHLYTQARNQLRLGIMQRYFEVLIADTSFAVENEAMAVAYVSMDKARDRHELGQLSDTELLKIETEYQDIRLSRYQAETQQRATRSLLAQALNQPTELPSDLEFPELPGNNRKLPEYEELVSQAMAGNLNLIAYQSELEATRHRMEASRSTNYPVLSGDVQASYYNREFGSRNPFEAGVTLDIPLYTGDRKAAATTEDHAEFMRLQAEMKNEEFAIRQQLLEAWQKIQVLKAQREQASTLSEYRELYLDRSRALYEYEVTTDLGDAMVKQTEARLLTLRTEFELALTWGVIDVLLGKAPMSPDDSPLTLNQETP